MHSDAGSQSGGWWQAVAGAYQWLSGTRKFTVEEVAGVNGTKIRAVKTSGGRRDVVEFHIDVGASR